MRKMARRWATTSQIQHPAILPWFSCLEWRPSFRWYGHLARYAQLPDCGWTFLRMISSENRNTTFRDHASARALSSPRDGRMIGTKTGKPIWAGSCDNARDMRA
ncbi:MAG: hypothetical protein ABI196_09270 [Bradyrhizobium sp.]